MTWTDITVEQYQAAAKIIGSDFDSMDKQSQLVGLIFNMTPTQVDDLTLSDYGEKIKEISFLFDPIPEGKPSKYIKANGRTYFINYRVETHRFGQYVEEIAYAQNTVENIHKLMASIVQPVKKVLWKNRVLANSSDTHPQRAEDMLKAKFIEVYHSAVFFYRVYKGSMITLKPSLVKGMTETGIPKEAAEETLTTSIHALDGAIMPRWYPSLKMSL